MRIVGLAIVVITGGVFGSLARACSQHGTGAGTIDWLATSNSGGMVQGLLSLDTTLVAPTSPTTCTAGVGLGSLVNPLPAGFNVTGMEIVVMNTTNGNHTPLASFSFVPNSTTSSSLTAGSGSSSVPGTNPLFDGSDWFGFSSAVDPFVPPVLQPDEVTAFLFTVEVAQPLVPLSLDVQFAGGEGQADGTPIFGGTHPVQYFTAANPLVEFTEPVPEPSTGVLAAIAAAAVAFGARRRGRRGQQQ
jgi:hypothetical protein